MATDADTITDTQKGLTTSASDSASEETKVDSTEPDAETTEVDWKAKFDEQTAAITKLENDAKTRTGRRERQNRDQERDAQLKENTEVTDALRRTVNALVTRTASGETEELAGDLANIDKAADEASSTRLWERTAAGFEEQLEIALRGTPNEDGSAGDLLVDLESSAVTELIKDWAVAKTARDYVGLSNVVIDAHKLARSAEVAKGKESATKAQETEKEASKVREAKAGIHDLSGGTPVAGSGQGKSRDQILKLTNVKDISDDEYEKYVAG